MLDTQEITEFDLSLLPGWDEELKCEVAHRAVTCSVKVEYIVVRSCDKDSTLQCANARHAQQRLSDEGRVCRECFNPSADCWKVTPV